MPDIIIYADDVFDNIWMIDNAYYGMAVSGSNCSGVLGGHGNAPSLHADLELAHSAMLLAEDTGYPYVAPFSVKCDERTASKWFYENEDVRNFKFETVDGVTTFYFNTED